MIATCRGCGNGFAPGHGNQTRCRRDCGRSRSRLTGRCACGAPCRSSAKACLACSKIRPRLRTLVPCPGCGQEFWPWAGHASHARKRCGRCPKPLPHFYGGHCLVCTIYFETKNPRQRCCGKVHRARFQSRLRKLRQRGLETVVIPLGQVYRRDRGRCGLCGTHVNATLKYPHPGSATLDHIVPITMGGKHVSENVQLAHARCNIAKGNRLCGSQLLLLG